MNSPNSPQVFQNLMERRTAYGVVKFIPLQVGRVWGKPPTYLIWLILCVLLVSGYLYYQRKCLTTRYGTGYFQSERKSQELDSMMQSLPRKKTKGKTGFM